MTLLLHLASAMLWGGAGATLFILLLNRTLLAYPDHVIKRRAVVGTALVLSLVPALLGLWLGPCPSMMVPVLVLALTAIGELKHQILRRRHRAAGPVESVGGHHRWLRPVTTFDLAFRRYHHTCTWPHHTPFRFRIVHITDLHVTDKLDLAYFHDVARRVTDARPDVVLITGDLVTEARCIPLLPDVLRNLQARYGVLAILGNHDFWSDAPAVRAALDDAGIMHIGNRAVTPFPGAGKHVVFTGHEAPWSEDSSATTRLACDNLNIVLTHTADNIYELADAGADLVFAGHYHAGQGRLPYLGSVIVPSRYGRRFDHGHFRVRQTHLYVSAGIGACDPPLRLYCPPEILCVDVEVGGMALT